MLPWLQETFDAMQPLIGDLDYITREVDLRSRELQSNGGPDAEEDSSEAQKARHEVGSKIRSLVDSIVEKGILIKDPRRGLFDFPYQLEGELVNLCWLAGEPDISYWHTMDSGFAGRQPL